MNRSGQLPNLEKIFKNDDEHDFTPLGGSNLAAIFDTSKALDINASLRSQSQKKIENDKNAIPSPSQASNKSEVIIAKVVRAYKLQNGQYNSVGKLGIALTGNVATNSYVLILYRSKSEHISVAKLTFTFAYSVRENNYATYYDSNNDNWSILFDSTEACVEFAREIGISKYFLKPNKTDENVFYQDLTASSEGEEAKQDDKISVGYFVITSITQPLKMNTASLQNSVVEITSDNNWEKSLMGTRKNLKRILFLSPSKQISLGPGFPRDKDIALEIEILDIVQPEPVRIPSPNPIQSSGKASLISRMAKMGQSILPKLPSSTATDSEDTEEEVHVKSPRRWRNAELPDVSKKSPQSNKPSPSTEQFQEMPIHTGHSRGVQRNVISSSSTAIANPHGTIVSTVPYSNIWGSTPIQQQYLSTSDGQLYPIQSAVQQPMPTGVDPNINVFLSESRTHNAEIRMGMSKIADNVQKLLDKFHVLEIQNATSPNNERALESSLKMLLALKNDKATDVVTMEKDDNFSNNVDSSSRISISKEELKKLEDDLSQTKNSLNETSSRLHTLEIEQQNMIHVKTELERKNQELEASLSDMRKEFQKALSDLKEANDITVKYQRDNAILETKMMTLDIKTKSLEDALAFNKHSPMNQNDKAAEIKQIMNKTYQTLITKFTEDSYTTDYIKSTVAKTIKTITLQVLKEDKHDIEYVASNDETLKESAQVSKRIEVNQVDSVNSDLHGNSSRETNQNSIVQDEPPPIPPMDLDVDWQL